jgi:plastocyanin
MRFLCSCMLALFSLTFAELSWCGSLTVMVNYPGAETAKLNSAFIYLTSETPLTASSHPPRKLEMLQQDKQFHPYTLVVRVGDTVGFPNMDSVSHHVYSFSPPRTFELPLYAAESQTPEVVFEKPGVVALGCNIHDWMLAFLLVIDTPWYSEVKDNMAFIDNLPDGKYQMYFWSATTGNHHH